jgi:hypothetical protein
VFRDERILPTICHVNRVDIGNMFLKYMNVYSSLLYIYIFWGGFGSSVAIISYTFQSENSVKIEINMLVLDPEGGGSMFV